MSLAVQGARLDGRVVGLRAEHGRVVALGPEVTPLPGDDVVDGTDRALVPGLVNGHTHAAMTLLRGYGDDLPLMDWLRTRIWPVEARLTADDVYWGTRLACVEMIRTGTTQLWDMYWHGAAAARAVADAGLRGAVSEVVIDGGDAARGRRERSRIQDGLDAIADLGPLVEPSLGPHAIYTVSGPTLTWLAEVAAGRGVPLQIHLGETADEVAACVAEHGVRPAGYLARLGALGPRTVLAHGVWLDEEELEIVAASGATVVTNPVSNLKLAVGGVFPYAAARRRGVAVGLGTDGASSNNSLDLLQDVKLFALLQKHATGDPAALPAPEALGVATGAFAPALRAGRGLEVGEPADFLLVRLDVPELGLGDLVANLVYAASGAVVDTTVVAGRVLMRDGVVEQAAEVLRRAGERAARLGVR